MSQKVSKILDACSTQDTGDRTHLNYAASRGQLMTIHSLISQGQSVNASTCNGITALHDACWTGHASCAKHLVNAGAEVNSLDVAGQSPLTYASAHGHSECVKLLLESGAVPDLENQRVPPLHAAAFEGAVECVNHLMSSGADIEAKNLQQDTPLVTACKQENVQAAAALLQGGASVNVTSTKTMETPLHLASRRHNQQLSTLLIEYGANLGAKNNEDKKPSQVINMDLPDGEDMCDLFQYYEDNPRTLASICRLGMRHFLGPTKLNYISDLPLPDLMKKYLKCNDVGFVAETSKSDTKPGK